MKWFVIIALAGLAGCSGSYLETANTSGVQCITIKGVQHCYQRDCSVKEISGDSPVVNNN